MSTIAKLQNRAASAIISLTTVFALTAGTSYAEPFVEITHPNGKTKQVDCGSLLKKGTPPRIFVTCEFGKQVDINDQAICSDSNTSPSLAFYKYLQHLNTQHGGDCGRAHGAVERSLGNDPNKTAGRGWQDKADCTLIEAVSKCKQTMQETSTLENE